MFSARMGLYTNVVLKVFFFFGLFFTHRHEQEKSQGVSEISELRRRIKQLEEENEEMSDNRLQLIGKLLHFPLLICCKLHLHARSYRECASLYRTNRR